MNIHYILKEEYNYTYTTKGASEAPFIIYFTLSLFWIFRHLVLFVNCIIVIQECIYEISTLGRRELATRIYILTIA